MALPVVAGETLMSKFFREVARSFCGYETGLMVCPNFSVVGQLTSPCHCRTQEYHQNLIRIYHLINREDNLVNVDYVIT